MRKFVVKVFFLFMAFCVLTAGSPAWAAGEAQTGVTFADGTLSVSVSNMPLGSLLDDIATKAKIAVHVADEVKEMRVSPRYSGLSLKEGLVRILEEAGLNSYLLVYGDREQKTVSELFVMKGEKAPSGSTASPAGRAPGQAIPYPAEMPGSRMSPPPPPMVPIPMNPPGFEGYPEHPPLPPAPEADEMPSTAVPPPIPPAEVNEVPPPPSLP